MQPHAKRLLLHRLIDALADERLDEIRSAIIYGGNLFASNNEQQENLERVATRMRAAIIRFCNEKRGQTFHSDELRLFIQSECRCAPSSPDRILRMLRQAGAIRYTVASRSESLYYVPGDNELPAT